MHGGEQPPGDPEVAWVWRQLVEELDRRALVSLEQLQAKSDKLRE